MKSSIKKAWRASRRYLFLVSLLPMVLIYLNWKPESQINISRYAAFKTQQQLQQQQSPHFSEQTFRYPVLLLSKNKNHKALTIVATGKTLDKWRFVDKNLNSSRPQFIPKEYVRTLSFPERSAIEVRMEERNARLKQKCAALGLDVVGKDKWHTPNTWEFLVNKKYNIIWCNVFKAASSSWMFNFNILAGYSPEFLINTRKILLNLARERYPRVTLDELREAQNNSITFMIARNPFERLLSAYRDKIVFALPHSFHDKLGRSIVQKFRSKEHLLTRLQPRYPTFPEFVRWLLDQVKRGNFIDMHFISATSFCTPCLINFDMILKLETLDHDQLFLIEKTGLERIIAPEWRNQGKGKKTHEMKVKYYSQLTREEMLGLYEYYKYDFELFDYNVEEFLVLAKPSDSTA